MLGSHADRLHDTFANKVPLPSLIPFKLTQRQENAIVESLTLTEIGSPGGSGTEDSGKASERLHHSRSRRHIDQPIHKGNSLLPTLLYPTTTRLLLYHIVTLQCAIYNNIRRSWSLHSTSYVLAASYIATHFVFQEWSSWFRTKQWLNAFLHNHQN